MPSLVYGRPRTSVDPTGTWSSEQSVRYTHRASVECSSAGPRAWAVSCTSNAICTRKEAEEGIALCGERKISRLWKKGEGGFHSFSILAGYRLDTTIHDAMTNAILLACIDKSSLLRRVLDTEYCGARSTLWQCSRREKWVWLRRGWLLRCWPSEPKQLHVLNTLIITIHSWISDKIKLEIMTNSSGWLDLLDYYRPEITQRYHDGATAREIADLLALRNAPVTPTYAANNLTLLERNQ